MTALLLAALLLSPIAYAPQFAPGDYAAAGFAPDGVHSCGAWAWSSPLGASVMLRADDPCAVTAARDMLQRAGMHSHDTLPVISRALTGWAGAGFTVEDDDWRYSVTYEQGGAVIRVWRAYAANFQG